jgi:hypothetical protein
MKPIRLPVGLGHLWGRLDGSWFAAVQEVLLDVATPIRGALLVTASRIAGDHHKSPDGGRVAIARIVCRHYGSCAQVKKTSMKFNRPSGAMRCEPRHDAGARRAPN